MKPLKGGLTSAIKKKKESLNS